jgi:predicted MFS family arabinose efflux permease
LSYLAELRDNWRPLLAATIGIASGLSIVGTITSTIAPSLIAETGWSRSQFALLGGLGLVNAAAIPFIGRIADVLGVRRTALAGQIALPICYLAYSLMGGSITTYIAIFIVHSVIGMSTTATVYTRLAVQNITKARGLALAIVASGPALTGAIGGPILNSYVESFGWRASYQALAVFSIVTGLITFLLTPSAEKRGKSTPKPKRRARDDYPAIFRSPAFWILCVSMLLCNVPQVIVLSQLKIVLLENGVSGAGAAIMFSALSVGLLAGRFITGVALDRFNPYVVSAITLGIPSIGLFIIGSSLDATGVLLFAVFSLGFAFGAEGDIVAFVVARQFGINVYSSVMGLLTGVMSVSSSLGAALLSLILAQTGTFDLFLTITGTSVLVGAALLLTLNRFPPAESETVGDSAAAT